MTSKILLRSALIIFVVGVFTATLAAQSVELYPYAGGFWPSRVGGLTNEFRNGNAAFLSGGGSAAGPNRVLYDHDTFFTVNYGGGIKAMNVFGPIGFRADVRGRTIPNFLHESPSWPEVTGGLLSVGENANDQLEEL